jgi:hypothetical protein
MRPAKMPGDLPETGTLRQQFVDQGEMSALTEFSGVWLR